MLCVLYWMIKNCYRDLLRILFVNESVKCVRGKESLDHRVEIALDTIVHNKARTPIDLNILHRADVQMRGATCDWQNSEEFHTRLFEKVYGHVVREPGQLQMPKAFHLDGLKPHLLNLEGELDKSEKMLTASGTETPPYSSFKI